MSQQEEKLTYFEAGITSGILAGIVGGVFATKLIQKKKTLTSKDVLEKVKKAFLKEGPIEASYIHQEKEAYNKFAIHSKNYRGGILRLEDGKMVTYEFTADAQTGTVIDIKRLEDTEEK
jgi:predicted small secreted protein